MIPIRLNLPDQILISLKMFASYIIILTLYRIIFFIIYINEMWNLSWGYILQSFILGFRFDARLAVIVILPFLLFSWILNKNGRYFNKIWSIYWIISFLIILCVYVADFGYYSYLNTRLDASIIGLTKNMFISSNMVWETYPVIKIIILIIILSWLFSVHIKKVQSYRSENKNSYKKAILVYVISTIIFIGIGYGKWSRYPLRWSDAFYSKNNVANQLSINPLLYFLNTFSWKSEGYDLKLVKKYYQFMIEQYGINNINDSTYTLSQNIRTDDQQIIKANVIIIFLETFPTYKIGYFGNPVNPTPNYDQIAKQSIVFKNFFVSKFSTAGSIFSAMTGLPDIATVNKSSTRDPFASKQHLLMNDLKDYNKHFFIGGSANWGDIGGFFRGNVEEIIVHEEGMYSAKEINAWGISDYDLFMEAHEIFKKEEKPFISVILTAGHHPPFSIPEIDGFKKIPFTEKHKINGFSNHKDFNAFRFMDYSLGEFIRSSKKENYYNNTIFVILGDHGFGHPNQPDLFGALSLHNYHVPLTIFAPGLNIGPREIYDVASGIDLMPTIMGILSVPYTNTTLGKDLLKTNRQNNYAFMFTASNSTYGLLSNQYYVISNVDGDQTVYDINNKKFVTTKNIEINKMKLLNDGIYHTARYLRYHNE